MYCANYIITEYVLQFMRLYASAYVDMVYIKYTQHQVYVTYMYVCMVLIKCHVLDRYDVYLGHELLS